MCSRSSTRRTEPSATTTVEIVTLLAEVAGAALFEDDDSSRPVVSPTEVGNELRALADSDPRRYAEVAHAITMLLG